MPGARQKPSAALAFKRGGRGVVTVLPPAPVKIPEPPVDLGEYALAAWNDFFQTEVSGAVNMKRDGERVRHWARCVDARQRLWTEWNAQPLIFDGQGLKSHPLFSQLMRLSAEIERAEVKLGMNPLDKMRLTGALDQAEAAESSIKARRVGRRPQQA